MDAECIFDGHHGQYIYQMIVDLADSLRWRMSAQDRERYDAREDNTASEFMIELADDAELWLNSVHARKGWSYGWYDGEFFYATNEWWEEI